MLSLLTAKKSFDDPWVGHRRWNERYRLHTRRMTIAEGAARLRRKTAGLLRDRREECEAIGRDGFAIIPDFLPAGLFAKVAAEAEAAVAKATAQHLPTGTGEGGYGPPHPFDGGFDRWDGSTLNRYLVIDGAPLPALAEASTMPALTAFTRQIVGLPHARSKNHLYLTRSGDETRNHDPQRDLHRDTFFSSMKFWLFLRPVRPDDGPFVYVPGSHLLTTERLAWEQSEAERIVADPGTLNAGGSFRIGTERLADLDLPEPVACVCEANTLVIANTMGFHARGQAEPGTERLALYGWRRPFPFGVVGR